MADAQAAAATPAAAVEAPRPKYVPKPVALGWKDVIRYLDDLWHEPSIPKIDAPLDVLALAAASIKLNTETSGKVVTIDATLPNLVPQAVSRPRIIERLLSLCGRMLEVEEDGVDSKVFDAAATIALDVLSAQDQALAAPLLGYTYCNVLSSFKYCVDEIKCIGPHVRLALCAMINRLDELEVAAQGFTSSPGPHTALVDLIADTTQSTQERSQLLVKMKLIFDSCSRDSRASWPDTVLPVTLQLLNTLNGISVSLFHVVLDLVLAAVCRGIDLATVRSAVALSANCAHYWTDTVQAQILARLVELVRVAISAGINEPEILQLISVDVMQLLQDLCGPQSAAQNSEDDTFRSWLSGIASKAIECVVLTIEKESSEARALLGPVSRSISAAVKSSASPDDAISQEKVLRRSLEFVIAMLNSAHTPDLLRSSYEDVQFFLQASFGAHGLTTDPDILAKTLELGSLFIRQKSDAKVFTVFLREHMVSSFRLPTQWETADPALRKFVLLEILTLGQLCVQNRNVNRYKYFVWFMPPIYELINKIRTDAEPRLESESLDSSVDLLSVLKEILSICVTAIKGGSDIDLLLRDGVPMILELYSLHNVRDVASMLRLIVSKFETGGSFFLLLELKFALDIARDKFVALGITTKSDTEELFRTLIQRGQREYIRGIIRVCINEFSNDRYRIVSKHLFSWLNFNRGLKELSDLCNICSQMFTLFKNPNPSVTKIATSVLQLLERYLEENQSEVKDQLIDVQTKLSRVLLIRNLFPQDFEQVQHRDPEEVLQIFESKFPIDVARDSAIMKILTEIGERIEALEQDACRINRRHVTAATLKALSFFFEPVEIEPGASPSAVLSTRKRKVEEYVSNHPKYLEIKQHLQNQGYSELLWQKDISIRVEIDDKKNIEENFKSALIGLYGEYIDMMKLLYPDMEKVQLGPAKEVLVAKLFAEDHRTSLGLEELRSRRNVVIKMLDKQMKDHPRRNYFQNRKLSLLAREDQLEEDLEIQRQKDRLETTQKRQYWCRLNMSYFKTMETCGKQIVGCYAPNGDHSEKVLENALKPNVAFISLYEEDMDNRGQPGLELENVEVFFTDQGLYLYKLYSNGHPYDTSLVWVQFFKSLLAANLVPAIIAPAQFPNSRVYNLLESFIAPEISGRILNCRDDYFEESGVDSYYDFKIEKVKQGDIIIDAFALPQLILPEVNVRDVLRNSAGRTRLRSSTGIEAKEEKVPQKPQAPRKQLDQDLVGRLLTSVMKNMKTELAKSSNLQSLSYVVEGSARFLSSFISKYVEEGILDPTILMTGFDLDQWNRRKKGKNSRAPLTESDRDALIKVMFDLVRAEMKILRSAMSIQQMFVSENGRSHCFELQAHLEKVVKRPKLLTQDSGEPVGRESGRAAPNLESASVPTAATAALQTQLDKDTMYASMLFNLAEINMVDVEDAKLALKELSRIMETSLTTLLLGNVERKPQEQLIKWIFGNEDRVWRDRGGRPGEETLDTFLSFVRPYDASSPASGPTTSPSTSSEATTSSESNSSLESDVDKTSFSPDHYGQVPFGGFVSLATDRFAAAKEISPIQASSDIVAYCVGDYVSPDTFEVVTAWVHPRYRGFGLAVQMYLSTMVQIQNRGDVLQNSFERMVRSSVLASLLLRWKYTRNLILRRRHLSYESDTSAGTTEQFEKICMNVDWALWAHKSYVTMCQWSFSVRKFFFFWRKLEPPRPPAFLKIYGAASN